MRIGDKGKALLNSPFFNKGTAFSHDERRIFKLEGLLPAGVSTLDTQSKRAYEQFQSIPTPLLKNSFLLSMHDQNEVLFYRLLYDHLKEMMPIIYTPTEGEAIQHYSRQFRRPEGCFLNIDEPEKVEDELRAWGDRDDIDYIIVTDSEEGVGGIGISIAKLVLMTLCAGLHPNRTIPVVLDVGTNNEDLLKDDLYLGLRRTRVEGERYDLFIDTFVNAVKKLFPRAVLHFEDFGLNNGRRLLANYRTKLPCFNDDLQGTGAVTQAAITAAVWVTKSKLTDQRIVIFGAGTAGTGIADHLHYSMTEDGKSEEDARSLFWLIDKPGLLLKSRRDKLTEGQKPYARPDEEWKEMKGEISLLDVVKKVKPTILIGCSTKPGAFTKEIVEEMARNVERPIIFPLSNPTSLHEAQPQDLKTWSKGKALIAAGSPFPPAEYNGKTYDISQANNALGIGLGAVLSRTSRLPQSLIDAAAKALAQLSPALNDPDQALLPDIKDIRHVSTYIAVAVISKAVEEGCATAKVPNENKLLEWVHAQQFKPEYRELKKINPEIAGKAEKGELGMKASH
ncbi:NAD-dependent malic enzyme, mitochondrial [Neolecta irregularis DAH-3]|uniref:NAD-dependent malic enzyme, mitochondrial n=1 Tax=Neolecta irregularis (strain DAH-3) TaxID=1198029 RepID=A0A1U7LQW6_NEOID|nr:NAD-dependent malic enzyme, mitochondrial [Neolecta irregularis DAH-3]|eukprot:OLL24973.1 NAD-dependent malic enzyme, mitochondrial [Neolecta irregularis DAH-3]